MIESFIAYFNATMAKPFRWTMNGKPLVARCQNGFGFSTGCTRSTPKLRGQPEDGPRSHS
jgi:hypothetical protein